MYFEPEDTFVILRHLFVYNNIHIQNSVTQIQS